VQRWRHAEAPPAPARAALGRVFAQGVVTQVLNPKVAVFFVAFLPQFLDPSRALVPQVAALGVVYIAIAIGVDMAYVLVWSTLAARFLADPRAQRRAGRFAATTYFALGVGAAVSTVK
jgi:threonine/homoserine/homoserine lactone efflux protein